MMRTRLWAGVAALGAMLYLTGCAGFFTDPNSTTSTAGSTTGDYIYVVNQTTDTVSGFSLSTGSLAALTGSPYALTAGLSPTSVVVTRPDSFVYVGGAGQIQCFSIGTSGQLTAVSGGGTTTTGTVYSMQTSPDGQWLLALSYSSTTLAADVVVYSINTSTGVLTQESAVAITFNTGSAIGTVSPKALQIAPSGGFVAAALGTAGDAVFTFATATGTLTQTGNILPASSSGSYLSDNALTFSAASNLLFVGTNGLTGGNSYIQSYSFNSSGVLGGSATQKIATGDAPSSLTLDSSGVYLYAANLSSGTITGYSYAASTAQLTALGTSPFSASPGVNALVRDKSDDYIIAISGSGGVTTGANDVTLYGFDAYTKGQLDPIGVALSGTDPAGSNAVAATY
jgi:6-phosphogluconolactonase